MGARRFRQAAAGGVFQAVGRQPWRGPGGPTSWSAFTCVSLVLVSGSSLRDGKVSASRDGSPRGIRRESGASGAGLLFLQGGARGLTSA
jgi:hypothetical protein